MTTPKGDARDDQAAPAEEGGSWIERVKRLAGDVIERLPTALSTLIAVLSEHVQVDLPGRRFLISHRLLELVLTEVGARTEAFEVKEFEGGSGGIRIRVHAGERGISALLVPQRIAWRAGTVTLDAATPEGIELVDRPVVTAIVGAFMRVFGSSFVGARVVAWTAPPGLTWDGRQLSWTTEVVRQDALPRWIDDATGVVLTTSLDDRGVWFTVDDGAAASLGDVVAFVSRMTKALASGDDGGAPPA